MLSQREKIIGWVAGVAIGSLVLDTVLIQPLDDRLDAAGVRVAEATIAVSNAENVLQNDLRARRAWKEMGGDALLADASAAESQVSNHVHAWAQQSGLALTSLKPERNEQENEFRKITLRATAAGTMQQITAFLYAVQTADIPIRVSDIQIGARKEGTDDLSLQIGLATIYLPPPPEDAAPATPIEGVR